MEESTKFYTEILGLKEVRRFSPQPGLTIALFKGEGEAMIELIENEAEKKDCFWWAWKLRIWIQKWLI